jgi:natural product biosynthesis luciferase-like monooxygenase protein
MVERGNVQNFFGAMDQRLGTAPGTWLAVTSVSFDISVLELLWTLARGYTVVLHREGRALPRPELPSRHPSFSLFYFANAEQTGDDRYRLMLDGARFADARGFEAVWTPERHFHAFGGIYPNPSVTSAAIAAVTHRVQIRGGSVVLPLHHPARVAEEWAVVDNISRGRVGIAFASGWQPNDFVLRPESYADAKAIMLRDIEVVRKLWRGEAVSQPGIAGRPVSIRTLPRPVQPALPVWLTAAGKPDTFRAAGQIGANILTHLLGQSIEELAAKLALYRQAWREAGHPEEGRVTLMLHAFIGQDEAAVKEAVREPLLAYLRSSVDLVKGYAWSFPALRRRPGDPQSLDLDQMSEQEREDVLLYAFERYYETSGLFGTVESCLARVDQLGAVGVDEVACLIDFGVSTSETLEHLEDLDQLRERVARLRPAASDQHGLPALVARYGVTHMQCTPSLARLLLADTGSRAALGALKHMLVGGELLSESLADDLRGALSSGRLHNMYGPTETTVWSTMHDVGADERPVPIGRPIANTQVYVLDARGELLPVGLPGELHIGGRGVTRGYLGQAEATAARFVPDSFAGPGHRLYRTGDRARWRADGRLEFLGRLDQQVKLTGYRIELGDVEAHCESHPDVRAAAVLAREDRPGETRLVAYVVFRSGAAGDTAALRAHLRRALPDFMVPSLIVPLDRLPSTPNGKVDRRALPDPAAVQSTAPSLESRPANVVEEAIAGVWRELLQLSHVGRDANFFDLGGHSLLAVQVHRRLRELLPERNLGITDLFRFPTIAALAEFLGGNDGAEARLEDGAARGESRRAALQRRSRRAGGEGA